MAKITEEDDPSSGESYWDRLSTITIHHRGLLLTILARVVELLEFDAAFQRRRKLTGSESENIYLAALREITVPEYDPDPLTNLAVCTTVAERVAARVGRADLDAVLVEQNEVRQAINAIAYRLYGVESEREIIEEALRTSL